MTDGWQFASATVALSSEEAALDQLAGQIGQLLDAAYEPDTAALYVASSNLGFHSATEFWAEARRVGLGVASPALFPWTLANAACGSIARRFRFRGPSFTFTGRRAAAMAALSQAHSDLAWGRASTGCVVGIDLELRESKRAALGAFRIDAASAAQALLHALGDVTPSARPADALARIAVT